MLDSLVHPSIHPSIHLFISMSIHPSINPQLELAVIQPQGIFQSEYMVLTIAFVFIQFLTIAFVFIQVRTTVAKGVIIWEMVRLMWYCSMDLSDIWRTSSLGIISESTICIKSVYATMNNKRINNFWAFLIAPHHTWITKLFVLANRVNFIHRPHLSFLKGKCFWPWD